MLQKTQQKLQQLQQSVESSPMSSFETEKIKRCILIIDTLTNKIIFQTMTENVKMFNQVVDVCFEITKNKDIQRLNQLIVPREEVKDIVKTVAPTSAKWPNLVLLLAGIENASAEYYLTDKPKRMLKDLAPDDFYRLIYQLLLIIENQYSLIERLNHKITRASNLQQTIKNDNKDKNKDYER